MNSKVCTCGGLEIAAGPVYPSVVFAGTRHCWDGRPCYLEPAENVAPDGGELVGYAARTFQRESPFWARSGESIEIGQLSPEESEKAMREAILGEQQPEPTPTDEPSAHDLVIADMAARKEFGLAKYDSLLQASNGRDNLQDLYEELLDACVYIRIEIERRKTTQVAMPLPFGVLDRLLEIAEEGIEAYDGTAVCTPRPSDLAKDRDFLKGMRAALNEVRP